VNEGADGLERDAMHHEDDRVDVSRFPWYTWGGLVWAFSDSSNVHPSKAHPQGECGYVAQIRLRRNDGNPLMNDTRVGFQPMIGDSELKLNNNNTDDELWISGIPGMAPALIELVANGDGRVGAILVSLNAARTIDAYRLAQTVFNRFAVGIAVNYGLVLRHSGMQITRMHESGSTEWARVIPISYPDVSAKMATKSPRPMAHFYASYAEGLRANSPFYALLCFFTLVEFLTTTLQGRFRRHCSKRPIPYVDLKGTLSATDVRYIGHFLAGTTYDQILKETREVRNGIAHFITNAEKVMPRPFNVEAEDQISFYRDALKVASRRLLSLTEQNILAFVQAGATDDELIKVIEGSV
jgi:Methylamine utilization protein MauJ